MHTVVSVRYNIYRERGNSHPIISHNFFGLLTFFSPPLAALQASVILFLVYLFFRLSRSGRRAFIQHDVAPPRLENRAPNPRQNAKLFKNTNYGSKKALVPNHDQNQHQIHFDEADAIISSRQSNRTVTFGFK